MDYFLFDFSGVQFHYTMSLYYAIKAVLQIFYLHKNGLSVIIIYYCCMILFYFEVEFYEKLEAYSGYPHG